MEINDLGGADLRELEEAGQFVAGLIAAAWIQEAQLFATQIERDGEIANWVALCAEKGLTYAEVADLADQLASTVRDLTDEYEHPDLRKYDSPNLVVGPQFKSLRPDQVGRLVSEVGVMQTPGERDWIPGVERWKVWPKNRRGQLTGFRFRRPKEERSDRPFEYDEDDLRDLEIYFSDARRYRQRKD